MEFIVDIQGFKNSSNEFIVKELAIIALGFDSIPSVYLFKPPFEWSYLSSERKSENFWLVRNYHGMSWDIGEVPYYDLSETLRRNLEKATKVHVKGLQKKRFLERYIPNIYNTEDLGCPSLQKIVHHSIICDNHKDWKSCFIPNCAIRNVMALNNWIVEHYESSTMNFYKDVDNINDEDVGDC